jgi:hypothetical protein
MKTEEVNPKLHIIPTVPLGEFETNTEAWRNTSYENNGMLGNVILANHFDIPKGDIMRLAQEIEALGDGIECVRAYIGTEEYTDDPGTMEMRLYFTGVTEANIPILVYPNGASAIFDFVTPCPPTCQGGGGVSE